jgi:energy-coupling factor transporter ATP-binding protein EcfA2
MAGKVIRIEGVKKRYGHGDTAVDALKGVDMQVAPGEVVGLVGPSGSGKSTLLKCLGAVIAPTAGRMILGDEVIYDDGWKVKDVTLPAALPLIVPSELVRVRPDIQAAEALLHVANAEYGVAIANLYPQINLGANIGSQALTAGELFGSGSAVWSLIGQLTQPLFDPGLPAQKRAALAAFDAAAANYQITVLEVLRQTADVLRSLENDAHRLSALSAAHAAAQGSLDSVQREYRLGAASYVQLLIAQQ